MSQATKCIKWAVHTMVLLPASEVNNKLKRYSTVFAGKDASRALAKTSTKPEDVSPEWADLDDKEKGTLKDWETFFTKRYNIIGIVEGATNLEETTNL
jgi:hypothetical protein